MNAQIIAFPKAKKRGAKVRRGPCAQISRLPGVCPIHWSTFDEYIYDHLIHDGRSPAEAEARIEAEIADRIAADNLPLDRDRLLFLAAMAMLRCSAKQS